MRGAPASRPISSGILQMPTSVDTAAYPCAAFIGHSTPNPAGSVSNYISRRRLAHCVASLRDPGQAHRSIIDICFSWGFNQHLALQPPVQGAVRHYAARVQDGVRGFFAGSIDRRIVGRPGSAGASSLRQRLKLEKTPSCRCQARHWGKTMRVMSKSTPCRPQASAEERLATSASAQSCKGACDYRSAPLSLKQANESGARYPTWRLHGLGPRPTNFDRDQGKNHGSLSTRWNSSKEHLSVRAKNAECTSGTRGCEDFGER
jgi:hypothetical protein